MSSGIQRSRRSLLTFVLFACCSPADENTAPPEAPCTHTVDDGVINVPSECPSLSDAVARAAEAGSPITIALAPGTYPVNSLSIAKSTSLTGAPSSEVPVVQCTGTFESDDAVISQVDIEAASFVFNWSSMVNVTITTDNASLNGGTLTDSSVMGPVTGSCDTITRCSLPQGDLTIFNNLTVSDSTLNSISLTGDGQVSITGSTFTEGITTDFDQPVTSDITVTDSSLGGIRLWGDGNLTILSTDVLGTGIVVDVDGPLGLQFLAENSYLAAAGENLLNLEVGGMHSQEDASVFELYNNVLVSGTVEFSTILGGCDEWDNIVDLRMWNNIFVKVELKIIFVFYHDTGVEDSQYNLFSNTTCSSCYYQRYECVDTGNEVMVSEEDKIAFSPIWENGAIEGDPLFVSYHPASPDTADLHLQTGSPAINAGDPSSTWNDTDGSRNDMGIYGGPFAHP
jgi:hypothetical protein